MADKENYSSIARGLRLFFLTMKKSLALKVFFIGFMIMFILSVVVYEVEKNHIVYRTVEGEKIEDQSRSSNIRSFEDAIWWTIVTSTTVGYGDYYPRSRTGRGAGILLMFFGISLVGIITGKIASLLVDRQLKEGRGLKELKLQNHFIICGMKRNMGEFLNDIMEKNKSFLPSEIVLINTADPEEIEILRSDPKLAHINFIHGDYIDEKVLRKANLKEALKVLILADRLVKGSVQEVDSRTVMTVITIKSVSKAAYTCAELLDSKFERYLTSSNCDEIILSSDYNRSLIANASAGSGISHIVSELLDVDTGASINTITIPKNYIGKTFNELYEYYKNRDNTILIGILENTGNFFTRKKEAIQEAQKTADISKLVDNLKVVKRLLPNRPIINPFPGFVLKKYSKAIIIEGRSDETSTEISAEDYYA